MAEAPRRGLSMRNQNENRLIRQVGKSNLVDMEKPRLKEQRENYIQPRLPLTVAVKKKEESTFSVFEDPSSPSMKTENDENNVIHMLEKKCQEQDKKKIAERSPEKAHRRPLASLRQGIQLKQNVQVYESDEEDMFSAHSQMTVSSTATIREEMFGMSMCSQNIHEEEVPPPVEPLEKVSVIDENALYCALEFDSDIYKYQCSRETKVRARSDYLKKQEDITSDMRVILFDWLSDIVNEYNLSQETLHLAVSLVDRLLTKFRVERDKLQLVGATAMMIAAKFEEIYPPTPKDFIYLTEESYSLKSLLQMEMMMLKDLHYEVGAPTAPWFARRLWSTCPQDDERIEFAMEYLLDLTLLDVAFIGYKPSYVGAACVCFALKLFEHPPWNDEMKKSSGIEYEHLEKIIELLKKNFKEAPISQHRSIYNRYAEPCKLNVSNLPLPREDILPSTTQK